MDAENFRVASYFDSAMVMPHSTPEDNESGIGEFTQILSAEDERKEIEEACHNFLKDKLEEISSLFADFIPKTGIKVEELNRKFSDLIERVKCWHPLYDFYIQKKDQELKLKGEEWLRSVEETKRELSKTNQDLSQKITAFSETEPAFETAKKFCNQFYFLYHEDVKVTLAELERKQQPLLQNLVSRIQIGQHSPTEKEKIDLAKIFDALQTEIQSHFQNFYKRTPPFSEQKNEIIQKWKEIKKEETSFKENCDLFCFLIKRSQYWKSIQKADFWFWRNSYRFIDEATAPFPSLPNQRRKRKKGLPTISVPPLSLPSSPLKASHSLDTIRLSTRRTQREETKSETTTEEVSEENIERNSIEEYLDFFKRGDNINLAQQLCLALAEKTRLIVAEYLLCFDQIQAVVASCSSFPKCPRVLKDSRSSKAAKDLISAIETLSAFFEQQAKELKDQKFFEQSLEKSGQELSVYKANYENKSLELIKVSEIKNQLKNKLEKRIKLDNKINFSSQTYRLFATVYCISRENLMEYQTNYQNNTLLLKKQIEEIDRQFNTMNANLISFKNNFENTCKRLNADSKNSSKSPNGGVFIQGEQLIIKGIEFPIIDEQKSENIKEFKKEKDLGEGEVVF